MTDETRSAPLIDWLLAHDLLRGPFAFSDYWSNVLDMRLGVVTNNWEVVLFADNLADDDTPRSAVDIGSQIETFRQGLFPPGPNDGLLVSLPPPRVIGIRAKIGFGK